LSASRVLRIEEHRSSIAVRERIGLKFFPTPAATAEGKIERLRVHTLAQVVFCPATGHSFHRQSSRRVE